MAVILKKQTIRNIASIVKADIDYEKGLVDSGTGTPSSLFLIYGDTGAGKTAILDALSLALYKTTPRIQAVGNRSNNSFRDKNGVEVKVFGIQQYSRIGISSKEECFTEVEFVDRKGRNCTARLELGYTSTGNYKPVTWKYTVDGKEYVKEDDIEAVRSECIGFDFAQYQQTCMLAQGKFDAFLTGGREERQRIMEQLTNTQKFTDYGNAITDCFNLRKKEKESAEQTVKNYSVLLLSEQDIEECKCESEALVSEIALLNKSVSDDATKKAATEKMESALNDRARAETARQELETRSQSADHIANVKTVEDWNNSNDARQALNERDKADRQIEASQRAIGQDEMVFRALEDDLLYRRESEESVTAELRKVESWLEANSAKSAVYAKEGVITTKMEWCLSKRDEISHNEKRLADEKSRTPQLQQNRDNAIREYGEANESLNKVSNAISQLNAAKEALHHAEITKELTSANGRKSELVTFGKDVRDCDELKSIICEKNKTLEGLKGRVERLEAECAAAEEVYNRIKIEAENTSRIYGDVMLSKDEMLQKTREQLAVDKAETCPLCGSHVADWAVNLDPVLKPLMEQKQRKDDELKAADGRMKEVISLKGAANGEKRGLEKDIAAQNCKLAKIEKKIEEEVAKTGLEGTMELMPQVVVAIEDVDSLIAQLNAKNQKVVEIDSQLKDRHAELANAQNLLRDKNDAKTNAGNALNANAAEMQRLANEIKQSKETLNNTISEINTMLSVHYETWQNDIPATVALIGKDAKEYDTQKGVSDRLINQLKAIATTIATISPTRDAVMKLCPSWTHTPSARQHPSANVTSEWGNLHSRVYSNMQNISKNSETKMDCSRLLDEYYSQSGNDEQALRNVMAKATIIERLRQSIDTLNRDVALQRQTALNADRIISECCGSLAIGNPEEREPLADITQRLEANKQARDSKNMRFGEVDNMIKTDANNHKIHNEAKEELERKAEVYEKWKRMNDLFGKNKLCLLVQSHIMKPLLNNANLYLQRITDRYALTFNSQNEQLSILVLDRYNQDQIRSATVLSGGERFMISLALSLALSALNRSDSNSNVLFIDEGFGTLDGKNLDSVMKTLEMLPYITGQSDRRVGIISHIEELLERIPTQIQVVKKGDGCSEVNVKVD